METTNLIQTSPGTDGAMVVRPMSGYTKLLCWVVLPGIVLLVFVVSPITGASLPVLLLPAGLLLWLEMKVERNRRANVEVWLWTFFITGTIGVVLVSTIQALLCYGLASILFGSETDKYLKEIAREDVDSLDPGQKAMRKQMSQNLTYWFLLAISSFGIVGVSEELTRYLALMCLHRYKVLIHERRYITYVLVAGVGFSTFENIGYVYASSRVDSISRLILTLFERVLVCTPATLIMAALIGVNTMRRDVRKEHLSLVQILGLPVFFHGLFDFMLMAISALNGNLGWVHPRDAFSTVVALTMALAILGTAAIIVGQRLRQYQIK